MLNLVKSDLEDVSHEYIQQFGFAPKNYNENYNKLMEYINSHVITSEPKGFVKDCIDKINKARDSRNRASANLIKMYIKSASNINNLCDKKIEQNNFDLARKTLLTLLPLI